MRSNALFMAADSMRQIRQRAVFLKNTRRTFNKNAVFYLRCFMGAMPLSPATGGCAHGASRQPLGR